VVLADESEKFFLDCGKKWYWPILSWLLDVAMHNSWVLFKNSDNKISNIDFRQRIVLNYLLKYGCDKKLSGQPSLNQIPQRFSNCSHFIRKMPNNKR
jgi:hypothetical protein